MEMIKVTPKEGVCGCGGTPEKTKLEEGIIPVLACEGSCVKGEIARLVANEISRKDGYGRVCHGMALTVDGEEADWVKNSKKVVLIDGCSTQCFRRILENIVSPDQLVYFDAISIHGKYAQVCGIDSIPEGEYTKVAEDTAKKIINQLELKEKEPVAATPTAIKKSDCCG